MVPEAGGGTKPLPCRARTRKTAIWARVTVEFGQKRLVPHPRVMPAAASCSTKEAAQKSLGTSANFVPLAGGGEKLLPWEPRTRKTAICARLTASSGQ